MSPNLEQVFWGFEDTAHLWRVGARLTFAAVLGGVLGLERGWHHKEAGLRTHMLVALGSALVVLSALESGMTVGELSRVLQGVMTGLGFLGAGTILKMPEHGDIHGLTTAACIWVTAGVGIAAGFGAFWPAVLGTALGWVILRWLQIVERKIRGDGPPTNHGE